MKERNTSERVPLGGAEESIMNSELGIPHNRVRLQEGVIRNDRAGGEFARQMSHELRTPLNVIIGLCQYLERDQETPLNERQKDTVSRMERNAHALLVSVNRLLENLRSGKYE